MTKMEINRLSLVRQRANALYEKYDLSVPVDLDIIIRKNISKFLMRKIKLELTDCVNCKKIPLRLFSIQI